MQIHMFPEIKHLIATFHSVVDPILSARDQIGADAMLISNPIQIVWKILGRKAKALVVGGIRQIIFSFYSLPDISIF